MMKNILRVLLAFVILGGLVQTPISMAIMAKPAPPIEVELEANQVDIVNRIKAINLEAGIFLENFYYEVLTSFETLKAQNADLKLMYDNGEIDQVVYDKTVKLQTSNFSSALPHVFKNFKEEFWAIMNGEKVIFYFYDSAFGDYRQIKVNEKGVTHYEVTEFYGDLGPVDLEFNMTEAELLKLYDLINQTPSVVYEKPVIEGEPMMLTEGMSFVEVYRKGTRLRHQDDLSKMQEVRDFVFDIVDKKMEE